MDSYEPNDVQPRRQSVTLCESLDRQLKPIGMASTLTRLCVQYPGNRFSVYNKKTGTGARAYSGPHQTTMLPFYSFTATKPVIKGLQKHVLVPLIPPRRVRYRLVLFIKRANAIQ